MNYRTFFLALGYSGLAGAILFLSHYHYAWIAAILVLIPPAMSWWGAGRSRSAVVQVSPHVVVGLSAVALIGLTRPPLGKAVLPVLTQVAVACLYAVWLMWAPRNQRSSLGVLGLQQVTAAMAIFLASAFWRWPGSLVVALVWGVIVVTTWWYLQHNGERAAAILASAWGLVAAEVAWVLNTWQVNYILGGGYLIIPQAALVLLGMGYCFASIYHSHKEKKLSRRRLIEYVAIAGVLLAIVIAGTRWNGTA